MSGGDNIFPSDPVVFASATKQFRLFADDSGLPRCTRKDGSTKGVRSEGFTLIEMMVALAVFSLAALALLRLDGATLANAGYIETRTLGQIVANNIAVDALTDSVPPPLGKSEGTIENGGRQWRWTRVTAVTADARIIRIDIAVVDSAGRAGGALSLARTVQ